MTEHVQCLIIGAGPAGYTAGIYAARANLKPVMYTGMQPGGQLTITRDVENYPGFPKGIMGPEMMDLFQQQADRFGVDIRSGLVTLVDFTNPPYTVTTDDGQTLTTDTVIIATGASAKWLGLPSESQFNGFGVSACAVCDGFFYRDREVAVVGGGDTACEEALYLSKLCTQVHLFVRSGRMRASKIMEARVLQTNNIRVHWYTVVDEILGDVAVIGVRIRNTQTGELLEMDIHGLFIAIGHQPNAAVFDPFIQRDELGYIVTQPGSTQTNVAGVYACGDVQDRYFRQAVTAAGSGCMAALEAERYLMSELTEQITP